MDDKELYRKLLDWDGEALKYIYDSYSNKLLAIAVDYLKCPEKAKEFLHDYFIILKNEIKSYKDAYSLESFITMNFKYRLIDKMRKEKRQRQIETFGNWDEFPGPGPLPIEILENKEFREILSKSIKKLSKKCQKTIQMYGYEGLLPKELSEIFGISESGIRNRLQRCREKLKQILRIDLKNTGYEYLLA